MLVNPISKSFNSRPDRLGAITACSGSVGMLAVLIYILMLEKIFRGKEEHSLVIIMDRTRDKNGQERSLKALGDMVWVYLFL